MTERVILEADGGSRGNPGPASYGALIRDADTGAVIAERGETIGVATNNVAEYSGLIAGLEAVPRAHSRRGSRGADGLRARHRAAGGSLEDQAPRHDPVGGDRT
ncbi:reverse transcriptase-like protein [Aeromicrobium sp. UC242_57]|uniref:reverse transcriptase-like protein n=1 Tax=Aeromicrobium sp. UC242_57 TaxID=3374624 RepID=UPI003788AF0D